MACFSGWAYNTHCTLLINHDTQAQGKRSEKHLSHFISFTKQGQQTITSLCLFSQCSFYAFPFLMMSLSSSPIFQTSLLVKKYLHTRITMYLCHTSHDRSYHTEETQNKQSTRHKQTKTRKDGKGLELCVICRQLKGKVGFTHSPSKLSYFCYSFALQ